jgi:MFS family permease
LLFGAATRRVGLGWIGDRYGRVTGLGWSILTYSLFAAAAAYSQKPWQLLVLWFMACTGVGGTWPNAVALVSEVWSDLSRPFVAGFGCVGKYRHIRHVSFGVVSGDPVGKLALGDDSCVGAGRSGRVGTGNGAGIRRCG